MSYPKTFADESVIQREISSCPSPEISIGFNGQFKKNKQGLSQDKGANLEKENSWQNDESDQFTRTEKPTKHMKKYPKRPDWNINKPLRRYIPASEKYPKQLQKQREEKKLRRQMELLHLVERNNPGQLSENRGSSPALHPFHQEAESKTKWHLGKKVKPISVFKTVLTCLHESCVAGFTLQQNWLSSLNRGSHCS